MKSIHINKSSESELLNLYQEAIKILELDGQVEISVDSERCLNLILLKLYKNGYFTLKELMTFCDYNSPFGGHPDKNKIAGVSASTGSLGHGLPVSVGIAMGNKIKENDSKTFVLVGDGELNEGSNWEAILLASNRSKHTPTHNETNFFDSVSVSSCNKHFGYILLICFCE